jgi:hypothetical protein
MATPRDTRRGNRRFALQHQSWGATRVISESERSFRANRPARIQFGSFRLSEQRQQMLVHKLSLRNRRAARPWLAVRGRPVLNLPGEFKTQSEHQFRQLFAVIAIHPILQSFRD